MFEINTNTTADTIEEHLGGFEQGVEMFDIPDEPEIEDEEPEEIEPETQTVASPDSYFEEKPKKSIADIRKIKKKAAKQVVNIPTKLIDWLIGLITGIDERNRYRPDKEDLKDIEDIVFEMLPDEFNVSPWLGLVLVIGAAYMPIVETAKKDLKQKKKNGNKTIISKKKGIEYFD